jgi:hypothetical protein
MAERRGRVSEQVGGHLDRATRKAFAPPAGGDDSFTQLENVASEAWVNLIGPDGFLPVLLLIFLAMVAPPLVGDTHVGAAVSVIIGGAALVLTVFRSTHRVRVRRVVLGYVCAAALATAVSWALKGTDTFTDQRRLIVVMTLNLVVLLMAFPLVLIRAFQHRRITVNTVCATLSAYLLIGLMFTTVYRLYGQLAPPFFTQFAAGGEPTPGEYTYFSFIVLTTVGFGDLTPAADPARAFVMVEAVIGQIFLVTMLARVVAMLGAQRMPLAAGFDDGDEGDRGTDEATPPRPPRTDPP